MHSLDTADDVQDDTENDEGQQFRVHTKRENCKVWISLRILHSLILTWHPFEENPVQGG